MGSKFKFIPKKISTFYLKGMIQITIPFEINKFSIREGLYYIRSTSKTEKGKVVIYKDGIWYLKNLVHDIFDYYEFINLPNLSKKQWNVLIENKDLISKKGRDMISIYFSTRDSKWSYLRSKRIRKNILNK